MAAHQVAEVIVSPPVIAVVAVVTCSETAEYGPEPGCWIRTEVNPPVSAVGEPPPFALEVSMITHSDAWASVPEVPVLGEVLVPVAETETSSALADSTPEQPRTQMEWVPPENAQCTVIVSDV